MRGDVILEIGRYSRRIWAVWAGVNDHETMDLQTRMTDDHGILNALLSVLQLHARPL